MKINEISQPSNKTLIEAFENEPMPGLCMEDAINIYRDANSEMQEVTWDDFDKWCCNAK